VRTTEAAANFGCTGLPHPPYSLGLAPSECHLFGPLKTKQDKETKMGRKSCKNSNTLVTGNCITPCASGCGGAKSFNEREYMLVFKDGKKLSTKMEATLKNNYAVSVW